MRISLFYYSLPDTLGFFKVLICLRIPCSDYLTFPHNARSLFDDTSVAIDCVRLEQ